LNVAGKIEFSYSINGEYYSQKHTSVVCPTWSLVTASGCYNCDMGVTIVIQARSTCTAGFVFLESSDPDIMLDTKGLAITMTTAEYTIYLRTPKASNTFQLRLVGSNVASNTITFTAISPSINLATTSYQDIVNIESDKTNFEKFSKSIDDWFTKVFNGNATWWEYLLLALGGLLAIIIVVSAVGIVHSVTKPILNKSGPITKSYFRKILDWIKTKVFRINRTKSV
jgi:hypothetical protein